MWAIRAALLLLILLVIIGVTLLNNAETVAVNLLFVRYDSIPLIAVIYWSFLAGIVITIVLGLSYVFKLQSEIRRRGKEMKRLSLDVADLNRQLTRAQEENQELAAKDTNQSAEESDDHSPGVS